MGRCGQGKTHRVLTEIQAELNARGDDPLILLVPEQFTLQAEREVINRLNLPGIMRLEVLSPSRLASRVLNETGGRTRVLLSQEGRYMVLKKVISACEEQLTVYRQACRQPGFIDQCGQILAELKASAVDSDALQECAGKLSADALLHDKLADLALIYQEYNAYLQNRYVDSEDYLNLVTERLPQSRFLQRARVWIDNFTTFSPTTLKLLEQLMKVVPAMTVSLTLELGGEGRDREIFALSRYYYNRLHDAARRAGLEEHIITVENPGQNLPAELMHLEKELYAYPHRVYSGEPSAISIAALPGPQDEVEYLAMGILSLVQQEKMRFRDIAVICSDTAVYSGLIKRVFDEYGIPFFLDDKRSILHHALVELMLSALDILDKHYRLEDVLRFIKTGLMPIDARDCDRLENYAWRYNIRGNGWLEDFSLGEEELRQEMNVLRQALITPLQKLLQKITAHPSWTEMARAWFEWLEEMQIPRTLESWVEELIAEGRFELASENSQIWNVLVELLDQIAEIMGQEVTDLKQFRQVLEAGLACSELGFIPSTVDQVLVGTATRSISKQSRVLFVVGVNDGLLPRGSLAEGILSLDEKEILQSHGVEVGVRNELLAIEEDFLIYQAFNQAREAVRFSYSLADADGKSLRPSLLIDRLKQLYPGITVKLENMDPARGDERYLLSAHSSFKYLIESLRQSLDGKEVSPRWQAVYDWYKQEPDWQFAISRLEEALLFKNQPGRLDKSHLKRVYGASPQTSISRLELYAACPFAHFVRYGLKPLERKTFEVKAPDIGDFFHQAILQFALEMREKGLNWQALSSEQCQQLMGEVVDQMLPDYGEGVFMSTYRYRYLGQRLKRIGQRAVWTLARHLQAGEFNPLGYELRFGVGGTFPPLVVELANGEMLMLEGRIDRVDVYRQGKDTYVRIIDYKSGSQDLDLSEVYYGLNLQLLIYLMVALQGINNAQGKNRPGGIFYFHIEDPLIEADQDVIAEIEKKMAARLRLRGLALEDPVVIRAMDRDIKGYSQVVPVGMSEAGDFYSNSALLSLDQFEVILTYVQQLIRDMSQGIMSGDIEIAPYKKGTRQACSYCDYHAVCQFDSLFAANRYRQLAALDRDQLMERIYTDAERRGSW